MDLICLQSPHAYPPLPPAYRLMVMVGAQISDLLRTVLQATSAPAEPAAPVAPLAHIKHL